MNREKTIWDIASLWLAVIIIALTWATMITHCAGYPASRESPTVTDLLELLILTLAPALATVVWVNLTPIRKPPNRSN